MAQNMGNMAFLDSEIIIAIDFCMFDLTIHQDNKGLAFLAEKYITQSLHGKIVRYKCNLLTKFCFLTLNIIQ